MEKGDWIYIMASRRNGTLYIGVTSDLVRRVWEHREGVATKRYGCKTLVWYEHAPDIASAIQREKQMKEWQRHWKLRVIERMNPDWNDLFETVR